MKTEIKLSDYDNLECPYCDEICKPVKVKRNGTVVYSKHDCDHGEYQFEIDINGDFIG